MKALMLAENLDANSRSPVGDTALHLAAQHGRLDVVKWLIENGADVMAKDMELNGSPIIFAAIGGHPEVVRALVEGGANVDEAYTSPDNSVTPLMFSTQYAGLMKVKGDAWEKHTEVVRTLCDLKADGKHFFPHVGNLCCAFSC
jgi:ankyrin repeat protein